jgi:hypothetical protein
MNLTMVKNWGIKLSNLKETSQKPWFYPAALLLIGLISHLYAIGSLGYFWDDWEVVFLLNTRNLPLMYGYFAFDRPFAWPYQIMYEIFGMNPIAWHLVTLLLRWAGILLIYYSLRVLWPRYDSYLRWLGAILIVYPGFFQQSISAAYNRHFTAFFLFGLSIYLMVLAVKYPKRAWILFPLSWLTAFIQVFTIEYFVGLELIRPFILWLLVFPENKNQIKRSIGKTIWMSLPFLIILGFYFWWRLFVFPTTISRSNYAGDFKMLQDFRSSILGGSLTLLTRAFLDFIYSTLQVWLSGLTGLDGFTFQSKVVWFSFGVGILLTILFALFQDVDREELPGQSRTPFSLFLFGFWAFLTSSLSTWLTSKQLSAGGRWDDRFSLAVMFGAGLMALFIILWLVRAERRKLVLSLLLVFSITTQILTVNKYRLDWVVQHDYYWQLAWRVPALMPDTAVVSLEQPSESIPGYDASFAVNILFNGNIAGGSAPYWFFTNNRFLNFDFRPGIAITYNDRNLHFNGNTSNAISIIHQGQDKCLEVMDSDYTGQPFYSAGQDQLIAVSNTARILPNPNGPPPNTDIFGPEPSHDWCFYFEKADLARQGKDWTTVLNLEKQAKKQNLAPKFGPEYIPFIQAHAYMGDWKTAYDLSLAVQKLTTQTEPLLCQTWDKLSKLPSVDMNVVDQANQSFTCSKP